MTATAPRHFSPRPAPGLRCPECQVPTRWLPYPLLRWFCADCEVSWRNPCQPGLRENPSATANPFAPALVEIPS